MNHQTSTVPQVIPQVANQLPQAHTQPMTESPFRDSGFAILVFSPGDNPIACLNKAMAFLIAVASLSNATSSMGNTTSGHARVVRCYNCQGEGHMARQCTQPKRPRNAAWYKEKAMLVEAQEAGQILDEEQLTFLADPGILTDQAQTIIPHNAAFQTKDLDTFDIIKCNGRIPRGFSQREPTFQVTLDAIALTTCFLITADVPEVYMHQFWNSLYKHDDFYRFKIEKKKRFKLTLEVFRDIFQICLRVQDQDFDALPIEEDTVSFLRDLGHTRDITSLNDVVVDQMHQPWRTFAALINKSLSGKTSGLDKLRLSRAQIIWSMYFQKNVDYVELLWEDFTYQIDNKDFKKQEKIKETSQIYGAVLPECLTSSEMKESKAYKTYLVYATGAVPPKIARKFKKASPTKKDSDLVPVDEEPVTKGKRIKRSVKKSSTKPATGIVIREPPVKTKSKGKEKEKVDVAHGKGIELLSKVALTEKAQLKEVRKKSLRDFHKTHPSGSGTGVENPPSVEKITPTVTSEGTGDKQPGVPDVTEDDSIKSESGSWGNDEEDSNNV
ncbi:retrovirus-related pol polyprotein from transposon TNT 1-94 [Tanacetum coccineum]